MNLLKPIVVTGVTLFILSWALPSISYLNWTALILASVVLTLLQKIARPVLNILLLPINVVTLGLFAVVINVALLWLATYLVPGFVIEPLVLFGIHFNDFFTLVLISFVIDFMQGLLGFIL